MWFVYNNKKGYYQIRKLELENLLQRLAEYERYLGQDARNLQVDNGNGGNVGSGAVLQRAQLEGDLHRIQELFPGDNLRLHERDVLTTTMKNVVRKRGTGTGAEKLTRALSQKSLTTNNLKTTSRTFLLETPVQFTTGVQSQDRHLFLFTDLLLIAKARSNGNFKLKQSVKISEIWLTVGHIEDVCETHKSSETSFVVGWPTTNVVATFMTAAARDLWWTRLNELLREESLKEPPDTNIQVQYHDNETNNGYKKTITVGSEMTASTVVNLTTRIMDLQGPYQLWAKTTPEESPYPLIGHERPFAMKLSNLRQTLSTEEGFDLEHCNKSGPHNCHFILKQLIKSPTKKHKSRITGLLRRSLSLNPRIFGVNLSKLEENGLLKPVMVMLQQLFVKGPFVQGIFRKSANVRIVKELREQIETSDDTNCLEEAPIVAVAALLKEFLRSLPDPLLTSHLFPLWMSAAETPDPVQIMKSILERLPKPNYNLLSHLVCVLHHVARRSKHNLMSASNLGVCCGPSLLWSVNPTVNQSKVIPNLTGLLIRHCEILFGEGVTQLFGEERSDSGAEESTDSLHSGGLSLDSLDLTEPPRKDHMSLSRDSGLTLSDCQLFVPESPVGSEDMESNNNKIVKRIYGGGGGGWEDNYQNRNFQRQDWLRAQLKRTPRTKLEEDNRKDIYNRNQIDNCKDTMMMMMIYHRREMKKLNKSVVKTEVNDLFDLYDEDEIEDEGGGITPPPLPPRLRHLPPVHMNYQDRLKVSARVRSSPPPYRPPPEPRAPITTRHLGYGRSIIDDESYV